MNEKKLLKFLKSFFEGGRGGKSPPLRLRKLKKRSASTYEPHSYVLQVKGQGNSYLRTL